MQIVRELAGYSFGRSDLVRRAMSKKKASVMEKERKNFVYGNPEENVPGCIAKGISETIANKIFDEMTDFAKYAFNKSHAAAYAVISYQTAYLKLYYPVEFMAALMTSVIDFPAKVAGYIYNCRQMGIPILPPDVNEGEAIFSVSNGSIRYGLSAIKGLGKQVIDTLVREREQNGRFKSLKDFTVRLSGKEVNKRTVENFIKAGAFDSLPGTRKQLMMIYAQVLDSVAQEKKKAMTGQITMFDLGDTALEEHKEELLPQVGEYEKEERLEFEKEVLGIYISGHPLEEYEEFLRKNTTVDTQIFEVDEETGNVKAEDGNFVTAGGMITAKTLKTTRNNTVMAFLTLEDMLGVVEVILFPRDYEKYKNLLEIDAKVLIRGKVSVEEDKPAKLVCQEIIPFQGVARELWIKFRNKQHFVESEQKLYTIISDSDGIDSVCIFCESEKAIKRLPQNRNIKINAEILLRLEKEFSIDNVKIVEKSIEKL